MLSLDWLDWSVIVAYVFGITAVGSWFYRHNTGLKEYLLGNRAMRWLPVTFSILAADTSAISYLGYTGWSFRQNMRYGLNVFAYLVAIPIVILFFLPIYSRGNLYTAYQYLENRFDLRVRLLATLFFLLIRGVHVAVIIYAPALVMAEIVGVPLKLSVLIMGALTALYTTAGGIKGVIWTDTIQVGVVVVGVTAVTLSALHQIPGGLSEVLVVGASHGKFNLTDFSFNLNRVDNCWAMLIGGTAVAVQAMGTDQTVLQKYFTTKSAKETTKSLLCYGAIAIPFMTLLSFLGVILYVLYARHPELNNSLKNADAVIPHYAARMLHHGLGGLVVASVFAGSMSTVSASLNSLATSTVVDVYRRVVQTNRPDMHYTLASRWATCIWGAMGVVGALYAGRLGALIIGFAKVQSLVGGVILGIFVLGIVSSRASGTGAIVGAVFGLATVVCVARFTPVSFFWYSVVGCASAVISGWLHSLAFGRAIEIKDARLEE